MITEDIGSTAKPRKQDQLWAEEPELWTDLYALAGRLFAIPRSLTGPGVRKTLQLLAEVVPELEIRSVPSGTRVFDWTIPDEWTVREAFVVTPDGRRILDFHENNLHLMGYSIPVDRVLPLEELNKHLYSEKSQPDAIPYVTSYYQRRWGFCLSHREKETLVPGEYRVTIDATLAPGVLNYGEAVLPGHSEREVLLSTYICHPSLANNEISGPVVTGYLGRLLRRLDRRWTYRLVWVPETIGAIAFIAENLQHLKERVIAGYVVTCVGDDRAYSYLPSRRGGTLADRAALHVLENRVGVFDRYSFLDRGSDERQYCCPGLDLPVASVMRSKYGTYAEYHTSLDDMSLISPSGLGGAYEVLKRCLAVIEENSVPRATVLCEPQLGRRGLYPTLSRRDSGDRELRILMDTLAHADGERDTLDLAEMIHQPFEAVQEAIVTLHKEGLLRLDTETRACT